MAAALVVLAGCGASGDDRPAATATPSTPTPTPTPTRTPAIAAARLPVTLTVQTDGQVSPRTVSVPARLAIQLAVRNRTPAPVSAAMEHVPGELDVPAGASRSVRVDPLPKGRYVVSVRGAGRATIIAGVAPGP